MTRRLQVTEAERREVVALHSADIALYERVKRDPSKEAQALAQLIAWRSGLRLELAGLRRRDGSEKSVARIVRDAMVWEGSRAQIFARLNTLITDILDVWESTTTISSGPPTSLFATPIQERLSIPS